MRVDDGTRSWSRVVGTKITRRENTEDERCEGNEREEHEGVREWKVRRWGEERATTKERESRWEDHVEAGIESRRI
jgi:hypothetical protein